MIVGLVGSQGFERRTDGLKASADDLRVAEPAAFCSRAGRLDFRFSAMSIQIEDCGTPGRFEPATIGGEVRSAILQFCQTTFESEEGRTLRAARTNPVLMPAGHVTIGLDQLHTILPSRRRPIRIRDKVLIMADDYLPSTQQGAPTPELRSMVEGALNRRMTSWSKPDTGFSPAQRYRLMLDDGSRVFVKAATSDETEAWLRNEYVALRHAPTQVAPQIVAWVQSNDGHSALITEHLDGHWPASHAGVDWRPGDIDSVLEAASMLADSDGAVELPEITDDGVTWPQVLSRAGDFLSLNLCSSVWFQESFGILSEAEQQLSRGGVSLVHGDLRSDNICIVDGRAVFVDWSNAGRGSPQLDLAGLLPTLQLEADVDPYDLMPDGGAWASSGAAVAALLAMRERQAPMWLRRVWRRLAAINLSWAARSLGLAPPDGTSWREL